MFNRTERQNICERIWIFVFAKNVGKNLSNKYSQKLIDTAKKSTTDAIKTASKRAIQKTAYLLTGNGHFYTTVDLCKKWLADFNAGKIQLVSFDLFNNWFY